MLKKLLFLCFLPLLCFAETISVIIPCHYVHFKHIPELLSHIQQQTLVPNEVIISLSEEDKIDPQQISAVETKKYPFALQILRHKNKLGPGENRNCACEVATGDIFITADADDIPQKQRFEIIAHAFKNYDVVHVVHKWSRALCGMYLIDKINRRMITTCADFNRITNSITNGNIAIRKEVFKKIRWSNLLIGEDVQFNKCVVTEFKKTMFIEADLHVYRQHLSSYHVKH